ncbi:hypothetical protein [Herbiconiux ginsengi]|uniref:Uncharacterized protein n=1 Tax=Herbiconiux ginsengi TaxID=381665 RepID=A0A1H3MNS3_9MICO|nr:hypothetical protein [Herbiconiux ginsengi]SDY78140.1 hypothetical protein SAMN05216554_1498 [Herbiconiux ginsengi]
MEMTVLVACHEEWVLSPVADRDALSREIASVAENGGGFLDFLVLGDVLYTLLVSEPISIHMARRQIERTDLPVYPAPRFIVSRCHHGAGGGTAESVT